MLVEFYYHQELGADGGLAWTMLRGLYERERVTERGRFIIWGFNRTGTLTSEWECPLRPQFGKASNEANSQFWATLEILTDNGLLERVRHLVERDGNEAEIVFPCPIAGVGTEAERRLSEAATDAAWSLVAEADSGHKYQLEAYDFSAPVPDSFPDVIAVDVFRTRYRARTAGTARWWAQQFEWGRFAEQYEELARQAEAGEALTSFPQKNTNV